MGESQLLGNDGWEVFHSETLREKHALRGGGFSERESRVVTKKLFVLNSRGRRQFWGAKISETLARNNRIGEKQAALARESLIRSEYTKQGGQGELCVFQAQGRSRSFQRRERSSPATDGHQG